MTARPRDAEPEEPLAKRSRTAAQQPRPPHPEESAKAQRLGRRGLIDRAEFVRLLQQSLAALGFVTVSEQLQRASGVACESQQAARLRRSVLAGDWPAALAGLDGLALPAAQVQRARTVLAEQLYIEALGSGNLPAALHCLRCELAPLHAQRHPARLANLAAALAGAAPAELQARCARWAAGGAEKSRCLALSALQALLPPGVLMPDGRLEALVESALEGQLAAAPLRNARCSAPSLLRDYACGAEQLPTATHQVLREHCDEVWHLGFSPDGSMLATASRDGTAIIWDVAPAQQQQQQAARASGGEGGGGGPGQERVTRRHVLRGHSGPIAFLAWSPGGDLLATCGQDAGVRIWEASTGRCSSTLTHHREAVTCAAWLPCGTQLVTGSHDRTLCVVDVATRRVAMSWRMQRIQEVAVAKGGRYILVAASERRVRVIDLRAAQLEGCIPEGETLVAMAASRCGRYCLASLANQAVHLWDLGPGGDARLPPLLVGSYTWAEPGAEPPPPSRFVVRSCLGGLDDKFVASGSEAGVVHMWHRASCRHVVTLVGHGSGTVNAVAWSPSDPGLLASASDDHTVRIWGPPHGAGAPPEGARGTLS